MPVTLKTTDTFERKWEMSWEFEADLLDPELDVKSELLALDLPGEWSLVARSDPAGIDCDIDWEASVLGCIGRADVTLKTSLFACSVSPPRMVQSLTQPQNLPSPLFVHGTQTLLGVQSDRLAHFELVRGEQRRWRLDVVIATQDLNAVQRPVTVRATEAYIPPMSSQSPSLVRLFFPKSDLELWTTSEVLSSASPYFATLFESGFAETVGNSKKRLRSDVNQPTATTELEDGFSFDDSDDEADLVYLKGEPRPADPGDAEYREIKIAASAYSTYRAVITWASTQHSDFSLLRSHFLPGNDSELLPRMRKSHLTSFHVSNLSLPIPPSPKSLYRLSHFLEMPTLQALALAAFKSQLRKDIVSYELVSDVAGCYDEIRAAAVEVAAEHFDFVIKSEAMNAVKAAMENDEALAVRFAKAMGEVFSKR